MQIFILNYLVSSSISQFYTYTYYNSYYKSKSYKIYEESSILNSKPPINLLQNKISYKKSLTISISKVLVSAKTLSQSASYSLTNGFTYSLLSDGRYTISSTNSYITVYFYYYSPTVTMSLISRRMSCLLLVKSKRFSDEQLIGIVCGSVTAFILILSIIILYFKRNKEKNFFVNEYDIINSLENEKEDSTEKAVNVESVNITEIELPEVDSWL